VKLEGDDFAASTPEREIASGSPADSTRTSSSAAVGSALTFDATAAPALRDPKRYRILGEHGRGGLGRVSRARDVELGRDVAIKELIARSDANELRFLREAVITARLEHPSIIPVHEAGRWPDGTPFYAMKLVSGRSLRDLIAERTSVDERIGLLHHVIAVADALAYAHDCNIIHRDLKPSNVVVGDFGETVVIDWGLAKNLVASDQDAVNDAPLRDLLDDRLTSAGAILGTPAYMAPEQARGERVDQRADVYAIGAMLWELCTLEKLPPSYSGQRRRILRRSGIDQDLETIIDKALAPDPERRYADAGALAADLKAFKAGTRIAARRYSPWAMLAHWTRRHRALTLGAAAVLVLAVVGSVLYLRAVTTARDRADRSEQHARRTLDELTLKAAQLQLVTDPSAALDALAGYHGSDADRLSQIRAEATGRGVALLRARPHSTEIEWLQGLPNGAILSLGAADTLTRTAPDGTSVVIARDVARVGDTAYSPLRHLLAYSCDRASVCMYDVQHDARIPAAAVLQDVRPVGIALSPNGALLAIMSQESELLVVEIADPTHPVLTLRKPIVHGNDVKFFENDIVGANTVEGIEFVHLQHGSEVFAVSENSYWDSSPDEHLFALTNIHGQVSVMTGSPVRLLARAELCQSRFAGLQFVPGRRSIAYACRNGVVGIWDVRRKTLTRQLHIEGHADHIAVSPDGDYVIVAGGTGTVTILDLVTDLVASYRGHEFRINAIAPPTPEYPMVISGDSRGGLRVWRLPPRIVGVAATTDSKFDDAFLDKQGTTITATTRLPELTVISPDMATRTIRPHNASNTLLRPSRTRDTFATHGFYDAIELWSAATMTRTREIKTGHGSVTKVELIGDSGEAITSGRDGRLVRWSAAGQDTLLARVDQPIDSFVWLPITGAIVFSTLDGALWRRNGDGRVVSLRQAGSRVRVLVATSDERTIYSGSTSGDVVAIETNSWHQDLILQSGSSIQQLSVTPDGDTLAVATVDGLIHLRTRRQDTSHRETGTWQTLATQARSQALTSDSLLIVLSTDGTIRIYSVARGRWLCIPVGSADLRRLAVSGDETRAVAVDYEGRLLSINLQAARQRLADPSTD
jgi:WD40 repeat protein/tRNA A-37 threonylcarbamoyl transferase component Bud32